MTNLVRTLDEIIRLVDTGDDTPLLLAEWADVLEEMGNPRAAGLRMIGNYRPKVMPGGEAGWTGIYSRPFGSLTWSDQESWEIAYPDEWSSGVYDRLVGWSTRWDHAGKFYPTRSDAILALAAAC